MNCFGRFMKFRGEIGSMNLISNFQRKRRPIKLGIFLSHCPSDKGMNPKIMLLIILVYFCLFGMNLKG